MAYEYQEDYALLLWNLQEKHGLSFDEATYFASCKYRYCPGGFPLGDFFKDVFGMDSDSNESWLRYFDQMFPNSAIKGMVDGGEPINTWDSSAYQWFRGDFLNKNEGQVRYCTRLWLLQEIAGCTFLEARAYLRRERNETAASLAEAYSISEDEVLAAIASAEAKAAEAETGGDLFHGYGPMYSDSDERIDWRWHWTDLENAGHTPSRRPKKTT